MKINPRVFFDIDIDGNRSKYNSFNEFIVFFKKKENSW